MNVLVLGKGVANDGVVMLLNDEGIKYDYLNIDEVTGYDYDLVVKAPGIKMSNEAIISFKKRGIRVISDVELAFLLRKKIYIGITGSNGKTTTTSLITHILKSRYRVVSCGNIGYSLCRALVENKDAEIFVVELSSFQLECSDIDFDISVLLNVHPCHLDHHSSYKNYIDSKSNICINQSSRHYFVYHLDDPIVREISKNTSAQSISFSKASYLAKCYIHNGYIYFKNKRIIKLDNSLSNKGFFLEDAMAAISATSLMKKIKPHIIRQQLKSFKEIEFRLTKINDYIYNDAKSTNPYSTIAALECFDRVLLICGGYDRLEKLDCLNRVLPRIKRVYAYGQTRNKVYKYMEANRIECHIYDSLDLAFSNAYNDRRDEIILFSPMFASFDIFENYIQRGKYFNEIASNFIDDV